MRLFVAIELPEAVRQHLVEVQSRLRPLLGRASLTKSENLHLTLKFLGEVGGRRAAGMRESLSKVTASAAIELRADRLDCFPENGLVRIVAATMTGQTSALGAVQAAIEQRCRFLGFERESRAYHPHATLARARPTLPASIRRDAAEATSDLWPGPALAVSEFVLVQSTLKPQGAEYVTIARFPLA